MKLNIEPAALAIKEVLRYQKARHAERERLAAENDKAFLKELEALNKASQRRSEIVYGVVKGAAVFAVAVAGGVIGARIGKNK